MIHSQARRCAVTGVGPDPDLDLVAAAPLVRCFAPAPPRQDRPGRSCRCRRRRRRDNQSPTDRCWPTDTRRRQWRQLRFSDISRRRIPTPPTTPLRPSAPTSLGERLIPAGVRGPPPPRRRRDRQRGRRRLCNDRSRFCRNPICVTASSPPAKKILPSR